MNLKQIITFSLLSVTLVSACKKENPLIELPFTFEKHIVIPIVVNGDTLPLVFDTGASISGFYKKTIEKAQLKNTDSLDIQTIDDPSVRVASHQNLKLKIGTQTIRLQEIIQKNDTPELIGMDVISKFYWLFDMNRRKVVLSRDKITLPSPLTNSIKIHYDLKNGGAMKTYTDFGDSIKYKLLIDTGYLKSLSSNGKIGKNCFTLEPNILIYSERLTKHLDNPMDQICIKDINNPLTFSIYPKLKMNNATFKYLVIATGRRKPHLEDAILKASFFELYDQVYINPVDQYIQFIRTDRTPNKITKTIQKIYEVLSKNMAAQKTDSLSSKNTDLSDLNK